MERDGGDVRLLDEEEGVVGHRAWTHHVGPGTKLEDGGHAHATRFDHPMRRDAQRTLFIIIIVSSSSSSHVLEDEGEKTVTYPSDARESLPYHQHRVDAQTSRLWRANMHRRERERERRETSSAIPVEEGWMDGDLLDERDVAAVEPFGAARIEELQACRGIEHQREDPRIRMHVTRLRWALMMECTHDDDESCGDGLTKAQHDIPCRC